MHVLDLARELADDGVGSVLYTDVSRDGMDRGAALEETAAVADLLPTIASGGVRGAGDVAALAGIEGVAGIGEVEVLVNQGGAEVVDVDGPENGLNTRHLATPARVPAWKHRSL